MYKQVTEEFSNTIEIKRSEFITTLVPVINADDADVKLKKIAKKYADATHNCYAYIASENDSVMRFSDDGEPQGTAGIPMLEVLKRRGLRKTLAVVTRYFGGVKLGASGLVSAYTQAVSQALDNVAIATFIESYVLKIMLNYSDLNNVNDIIFESNGKIIDTVYDVNIALKCAVPTDKYANFETKINDYTMGKANIAQQEKEFIAY